MLLGEKSVIEEPAPPHPRVSSGHRGSRPAHHHRRFRTFVCLRPHLSDCHLGSSRLQPRTRAAHAFVFARWNARFGSALTTPARACAVTTKTGSTAGTARCLARMASVPPWSLTCTLLTSRLRSSSRSRPHPREGPRRRPAQLAPN